VDYNGENDELSCFYHIRAHRGSYEFTGAVVCHGCAMTGACSDINQGVFVLPQMAQMFTDVLDGV
jgi:hypothetical protein